MDTLSYSITTSLSCLLSSMGKTAVTKTNYNITETCGNYGYKAIVILITENYVYNNRVNSSKI